jgi:uncharacterized protein (TIGR00266 family)
MHYDVRGELAQHAVLTFERSETCWAAKGGIMSYTDGVDWALRVPGGVSGAVGRVFAGEGIALSHLRATQAGARASLASNQPGKIFVWDAADGPVLTTRGSFLCAWGDVAIGVTVARRAGAAFFGGAGLFLQRVSGAGTVLIHGSGDLDDRMLAPGESLTVSTGHLAAFADSIDYDIRYVGGVRKMLFSGEGLFMTRLTGPGRVLLQTLRRRNEIATGRP